MHFLEKNAGVWMRYCASANHRESKPVASAVHCPAAVVPRPRSEARPSLWRDARSTGSVNKNNPMQPLQSLQQTRRLSGTSALLCCRAPTHCSRWCTSIPLQDCPKVCRAEEAQPPVHVPHRSQTRLPCTEVDAGRVRTQHR